MKEYNQSSLKEAINELLKSYGLNDKLLERNILSRWEELAGKMVAKHTKDLFISKGKLFITCDSAALRHELGLQKSVLIKTLNDAAGKELLKEIILK